MPNGVFVTVTVPKDRVEEFLKVMEHDMIESRKEEGCLRFDLLDQGGGTYHFYEVYKDAEAAAHHKTLPHYEVWAKFKASCKPVADSQQVIKFNTVGEVVKSSQVPSMSSALLVLVPTVAVAIGLVLSRL